MEDLMKPIRQELRKFENCLENDINEFNFELNLSRKNLFDYIDQQIEYLINKKKEYEDEFNYLHQENLKTCANNQLEFDKLCLSINQNDHDQIIVYKLFQQFKQTFPIRPKMLKSIPQYNLKHIHINDLIKRLSTIDNSSSSPVIEKSLLTRNNQSESNNSFIPINIDDTQISSLATTSIGCSYHQQLASQ
jgi:hypothetical protein